MTKSLYLVWAGLVFGLLASGCREPNPAYVGKAPPNDAGGQQDTPPVTPGPDSAPDFGPDVGVVPPVDAVEAPPAPDASADAGDAILDVGARDDESGGGPRDVLDLRDARRPDDDVSEVRPSDDGSRDATDVALPVDSHDVPVTLVDALTDGSPLDAAALDLPRACSESQTRTCSTPGNPLVGACHAGMQTCTAGAWGPCEKETLPAEVETCNGVDDNCNGMTDEGCVAECVLVAPEGSDAGADGTTAKPFATVAAALAFAAAVDGGRPQRVCVAGGATCADVKSYDMDAALAVPNGASLQGNYAFDGATLTYCASAQPPITTLRFTAAGAQVEFGSDVKSPTEVGGFTIERFSSTSGSLGAPITAVSVAGGKNVTLSGIFVIDAPAGDTTYGVDVVSGGQATIFGSSIGGGAGRMAAIGVHVDGGQVNLRSNCDGVGTVCTKSCEDDGLGVRGRAGELSGDAAVDSSAVYVTAASLSGSTIVGNLLCGGAGNAGAGTAGANVAALRCEGGNCGTVTGNSIAGGGGRVSLAVSLQGGGGLLEANAIAAGCGTEGAFAVLLDNASVRVRNNRISGSECSSGTTGSYVGLHVVLGSTSGELDVNSNDIDPRGGTGTCQSTGLWLERTQGQPSPAGIFRNNIMAAGNCSTRTAISEVGSATLRLLENNDLYSQVPSGGPGGTMVLFHRGSTDATTIAQVNALDGAAGNISANPRFVSYPDDLHLAEDSPCIDQGSEEGAPASDADGLARPQGEGFDIGAYEYMTP